MSLYYEAATFLEDGDASTTLSDRIYKSKELKSKPAQIYALVSEARIWSPVLSNVVEQAEVLKHEKKLTPAHALLLTHDLLVSKNGVAAPKQHALRLSIEKHRAGLGAELTKARIRAGHATLAEWKAALTAAEDSGTDDTGSTQRSGIRHARWVRMNTLLTTLSTELSTTFSAVTPAVLPEILRAKPTQKIYAIDQHIPNLLALPNGTDLSKIPSYIKGRIILQDKASCFPAYLLNPQQDEGDMIDACAAPGNKTTHLAALVHGVQAGHGEGKQQTILACERDKNRSLTLQQMTHKAGAKQVQVLANQDFLRLKPEDERFSNVTALLLDPSCSGSGIVGRNDGDAAVVKLPKLVLPRKPEELAGAKVADGKLAKGKKRKRPTPSAPTPQEANTKPEPRPVTKAPPITQATDAPQHKPLPDRLRDLSNFQLTLLKHAFAFPAANKIVYSTCSIHFEENEGVVLRALVSDIATARGWRVERRQEQVEGMQKWGVRGDVDAVTAWVEEGEGERDGVGLRGLDVEGISEACIRCEKGSEEGTMGFFAVKFVRDKFHDGKLADGDGEVGKGEEGEEGEEEEEEWTGFDDEN